MNGVIVQKNLIVHIVRTEQEHIINGPSHCKRDIFVRSVSVLIIRCRSLVSVCLYANIFQDTTCNLEVFLYCTNMKYSDKLLEV